MKAITVGVLSLAMFGQAAGLAAAQAPAPRKLQLVFDADKRVSLSAQNVTVVEILAEWARTCGCYVVNANRLTGAPIAIPIQFEKATQAEVLESLLRQAAGYVLTPSRSTQGTSNYETIYIIPTSTASSTPMFSSAYGSPAAVPIATTGSPDDEIPPVVPQPAQTQNPAANAPARPASPGVSVPLTTVTPFGASPQPASPAPARGGGAPPPPPR